MPATVTVARPMSAIPGTESAVQKAITEVRFAWTSTAGGVVDATTVELFSGRILRIVTIPGVGVPIVPLPNYDVQIYDDDNADVSVGFTLNRHQVNVEQVCPLVSATEPCAISNTLLRLAVRNAGAARQGTVVVYIE